MDRGEIRVYISRHERVSSSAWNLLNAATLRCCVSIEECALAHTSGDSIECMMLYVHISMRIIDGQSPPPYSQPGRHIDNTSNGLIRKRPHRYLLLIRNCELLLPDFSSVVFLLHLHKQRGNIRTVTFSNLLR